MVEISRSVKKCDAALTDIMYLCADIPCGLHHKAVPNVIIAAVVVFGVAFADIICGFDDLACTNTVAVDLHFKLRLFGRIEHLPVCLNAFEGEKLVCGVLFIYHNIMLGIFKVFCDDNIDIPAVIFGGKLHAALFSVNDCAEGKLAPIDNGIDLDSECCTLEAERSA